MGEEFSGLGSQLFIGHKDTGEVYRIDLPSHGRTSSVNPIAKKNSTASWPPSDVIVPTDDGFQAMPTGFSCSCTFDLPDSEETEILRDMMRREMPHLLFDVSVFPSSHSSRRFPDGHRLPRRIKKAMNHGGYYRRNTKWKRKAMALFNRYPDQSPFTIERARIETDERGNVTIIGRGVSKTQIQKRINK